MPWLNLLVWFVLAGAVAAIPTTQLERKRRPTGFFRGSIALHIFGGILLGAVATVVLGGVLKADAASASVSPFWAAVGGGVVGALVGSILALFLDAYRAHRKRQGLLELVRADIEAVVVETRKVAEMSTTHVEMRARAVLKKMLLVRSRLDASSEWFGEIARTPACEPVLHFYQGFLGASDLAARREDSGQEGDWASNASFEVTGAAKEVVRRGEAAITALDELI